MLLFCVCFRFFPLWRVNHHFFFQCWCRCLTLSLNVCNYVFVIAFALAHDTIRHVISLVFLWFYTAIPKMLNIGSHVATRITKTTTDSLNEKQKKKIVWVNKKFSIKCTMLISLIHSLFYLLLFTCGNLHMNSMCGFYCALRKKKKQNIWKLVSAHTWICVHRWYLFLYFSKQIKFFFNNLCKFQHFHHFIHNICFVLFCEKRM